MSARIVWVFTFIILHSSFIILSSCNSLIDVKPRFNVPTEQSLSSASDLEAAVNGAYAMMQRGGSLGGALKLVPDILGELVQQNPDAYARGQLSFFDVYTRNMLQSATAGNIWTDCYRAIEAANGVIDAIENNRVANQDAAYVANRSRLLGEAYFIRGIMHFELVRLYSHQYGVNQNDANSGIPLRLAPAQSRAGQARATTAQVYAQVEEDLRKAARLLPDEADPTIHPPTYGGRAGGRAIRDAAHGYLARVFFQKATTDGNDSAVARINLALGDGSGAILRYPLSADRIAQLADHYFLRQGTDAAASTLFQVVNAQNPSTLELNSTSATIQNAYSSPTDFDPENPEQGIPPIYVGSSNFYRQLFQTYNQNPSDQRTRLYFQRPRSELMYSFKFYRRPGRPAVLNIPVLRQPELVLTRAECRALDGDLDGAMADVNYVRTANGATALPDTFTLVSLPSAIRRERRWELAFEGDRWHDWKRRSHYEMSQFGAFRTELELLPPGGNNNRNDYRIFQLVRYDARETLFQLPDAEFFNNPNAVRNP